MARFHVVPRGDAAKHNTHEDKCSCVVEVQTVNSEDSRDGFDVWYYHRRVTLEEAVFVGEPGPEPTLPSVA